MGMTYAEFKDYLITFLWKVGDQVVIDNLDNLIRQANAELERKLRVEARHTSFILTVNSLRTELPADYKSMRGVSDLNQGIGQFRYVSPSEMNALRSTTANRSWQAAYSLEDHYILLSGPVADSRITTGDNPPASPANGDLWYRTSNPVGLYQWIVDETSSQWVQLSAETAVEAQSNDASIQLVIDYQRKVPDYAAIDSSWLEDEYLDLYVYTVLKHSAPFLREDERLNTWGALCNDALISANEDAAHNETRGVYAQKPLPRQAGINRRRVGRGYYSQL